MAWSLCHCGRCLWKESSRQRARQGDLYIGRWRPGISDQHLGEVYLPLASENEPEAETGFQKTKDQKTPEAGGVRVTSNLESPGSSMQGLTAEGRRDKKGCTGPSSRARVIFIALQPASPHALAAPKSPSHQSPSPAYPCLPAARSIIPVKPFALLIRAALCQNPLTAHHPRVPEPPSAESQVHQSADATVAGLILGIKGLGHSPQQWKRGHQGTGTEREGLHHALQQHPFANRVSAAAFLSQTETGLKPATNHLTRRQIHISHSHPLQTTEISSSTRPPRTRKEHLCLVGHKKNSRDSEDYH